MLGEYPGVKVAMGKFSTLGDTYGSLIGAPQHSRVVVCEFGNFQIIRRRRIIPSLLKNTISSDGDHRISPISCVGQLAGKNARIRQ